MYFSFEKLFSVVLRHQYFGDERLYNFSITATEETQLLMRRLGIIYKVIKGEVVFYYDTSMWGTRDGSRPALLQEASVLRFFLEAGDPFFFNYTSLPSFEPIHQLLHFHNKKYVRTATTVYQGLLHRNEFVDAGSYKRLSFLKSSIGLKKPFAVVDLVLDDNLQANYTIQFAVNSMYWSYVLVSDHFLSLTNPRVIHKEAKVDFELPQQVILTDGRKALQIKSKQRLFSAATPERSLQLIEEYDSEVLKKRVVVQALPNPDVGNISVVEASAATQKEEPVAYVFL